MLGLEGAVGRNTEVFCLFGRQRFEFDAELFQMEPGDFFVQLFGEHVDFVFVFFVVREQFKLGKHLVRK